MTVNDVGLVGLPAAPEAVVFSEEVTAVDVTIVETVPETALLIIALWEYVHVLVSGLL